METTRFAINSPRPWTLARFAEEMQVKATIDAVDALLRQAANDVADDTTDIDDGHPRFWLHVTIMGIWEDWGHEAEVGALVSTADTNRTERTAIAEIRRRFL